jgi:hypothetical protein
MHGPVRVPVGLDVTSDTVGGHYRQCPQKKEEVYAICNGW